MGKGDGGRGALNCSLAAPLRRATALVAALCAAMSSVVAQDGAERLTLDSLLAAIDTSANTGTFTLPDGCATRSAGMRRACRGFVALHGALTAHHRESAATAEFELSQAVIEQPNWAIAWYALGESRLLLASLGGSPKEGPLQPLGMSLESGGGHALVRALELDSALTPALTALALAPVPREEAAQLALRRDLLRKHRSQLEPRTFWRVAQVERIAGDRDSSAWMFARVLNLGLADSGATLLELARELHAAGRPERGRAALFDGAALTVSYTAAMRYREELLWVAEPSELASWDGTPVTERREWLQRFWAVRDARDGLGHGERLVEHYRRYEEALAEFRLTIPRRGRSRARSVALVGDIVALETGDAVGRAGVNSRSGFFSDASVGSNIEAIERERVGSDPYAETIGPGAVGIEVDPYQDVMDDRGLVWIRHGPPTERTHTSGGVVMEAWRYDRSPGSDLVLFFTETDFDGHAGASVLIPTPAGASGLALNQLCGNALGMCNELLRFSQPEGVMNAGGSERLFAGVAAPADRIAMPPELIAEVRDRGRKEIRRAITSDDGRLRFSKPLAPVVQFFGLRHSGKGPRIVVVLALRGDQLEASSDSLNPRQIAYPVHIRLTALESFALVPLVLDTVRVFHAPKPLEGDEYLTTVVELAVPAGTYQASLMINQGNGRGAHASLGGIRVPGAPGRLELSSLVLGRTGGSQWHSGTSAVSLQPLNAHPRNAAVELYYQVHGVTVGAQYHTQVELMHADRPDGEVAVALGFEDRSETATVEVHRSVGIGNLQPGRYRLRVTVSGAGSSVSEEGFLTVVRSP